MDYAVLLGALAVVIAVKALTAMALKQAGIDAEARGRGGRS